VTFHSEEDGNPYATLYAEEVVEAINQLSLPRYGLGNYTVSTQRRKLTPSEEQQIKGLSRAGKQLMGFSLTNLYKRLESGGPAFIQSLDRHILRNYISLYAIEQGLDLPIGSQEASLLDTRHNDEDADALAASFFDLEMEDEATAPDPEPLGDDALHLAEADYRQRAGRVDRIGQTADQIRCYSFLPVEGVERIIRLRSRLRQRLQENAEVVGTDEAFFEDDMDEQTILDLYHEKSGILDGEADLEVDLTSEAYQIWKNAIEADPSLKQTIENLPPIIYSSRTPGPDQPEGVLVYMKTAEGNDALALIDRNGYSITQSQVAILRMAQCEPDTPAIPRDPQHHDLVTQGTRHILEEEKSSGGQLGRPSGARFRCYERLKRYAQSVKGTLFESQDLIQAIDQLYRYPLRQAATDHINRQLKSGIDDAQLADLVIALYQDERLCLVHDSDDDREPQVICSLGLFQPQT
jgi:hypothetical protein